MAAKYNRSLKLAGFGGVRVWVSGTSGAEGFRTTAVSWAQPRIPIRTLQVYTCLETSRIPNLNPNPLNIHP